MQGGWEDFNCNFCKDRGCNRCKEQNEDELVRLRRKINELENRIDYLEEKERDR